MDGGSLLAQWAPRADGQGSDRTTGRVPRGSHIGDRLGRKGKGEMKIKKGKESKTVVQRKRKAGRKEGKWRERSTSN